MRSKKIPGIHTNAGEKGLPGKEHGGQLGKENKKWFLCSDKTGGSVLPRQCVCLREVMQHSYVRAAAEKLVGNRL